MGERARFEEVTQLIESLYAQEFMVLRRSLKRNFLPFSMGAKDQPLTTRVEAGLPTSGDLDQREEKLVADFLQLMAQARFHILSRAEWDLAKADQFMFSLPVEVNWDYYDSSLLARFWASSRERRELRALLPDMSSRCLVFHRGVTVAEASGLYTSRKIDLLVEYLVVAPATRLWRWLRRIKTQVAAPVSQSLTESTHINRKVVERRTLRRLMPNAWAVIKNLHKTHSLQEPSFHEVVVLYRAVAKPGRDKLPALQRPREKRLHDILAGRNIHVKCFHDIPMADIDVIFADKKVFLKPLTIIQLIITVVTAIGAALTVLLKGDKADMNVLWSALSLVAARCGQVYTSAQAERSATIQDMVNILYEKTDDAQEGVVSMLLEDMAEQQLKEAVLAYGMLLTKEAEMTQELLDENCETFLAKNFNLKVDFAVEDALPRLIEWGLVRPHKSAKKFEAVHVDEALYQLQKRWDEAFRALSGAREITQQPISDLLSGSAKSPPPPLPRAPTAMRGGGGEVAGDGAAGAAAAPAPAANGHAGSNGDAGPAAPAPLQNGRSGRLSQAGDSAAGPGPAAPRRSDAGASAGSGNRVAPSPSKASPAAGGGPEAKPKGFLGGLFSSKKKAKSK